MGFYTERVLPFLLDFGGRSRALREERKRANAEAAGRVLEIGFGAGASLESYPRGVEWLAALEPSQGMARRARRRSGEAPFPVTLLRAAAEALPLSDGSFDAVVSNLTLCSLADPVVALREVRRVLRDGGRFHFLEHGLAQDPRVARWQARLSPLQRLVCRCRLDLDVGVVVAASGLRIESLERFRLPGAFSPFVQMYRGRAVR